MPTLKVFISYSTNDGTGLAQNARDILKSRHQTWIWTHDSSLGVPLWSDIAYAITKETDILLYLCTESSASSGGQRREVNIALARNLPVITIRVDGAEVVPELTGDVYASIELNRFPEELERLSEKLPEFLQRRSDILRPQQFRSSSSNTVAERKERARYLDQLNSRRDQLNSNKVHFFLEDTEKSYLKATVPRAMSSTNSHAVSTSLEFMRISLGTRIRLSEFNNDHTYWGMYVTDSARFFAAREKNYLFDELLNQVPSAEEQISPSNPDFQILDSVVRQLASRGFQPNGLFAPVDLLPEFYKEYSDKMQWNRPGEFVDIEGCRLRVFWSSKITPIDSFLVTSSKFSVWNVLPDPVTGSAISIGLGQSQLYPDEVEYLIESLVKYEINDVQAFARINVDE